MLDVGSLVRHFVFSASFMVYHGRFLRDQNFCARPLLYVRACCGLVRTTLHYHYLLLLLLIIDVFDVARFISIRLIFFSIRFCTCLYEFNK